MECAAAGGSQFRAGWEKLNPRENKNRSRNGGIAAPHLTALSLKMEPTVIGDAVNVTSRLEGLTKEYGRPVLIGEAAAELVRDTFRLQFVDRVTMKGKTKPLRVYSVVSRRDAALDPQMAAYLEAYDRAHAAFAAGDLKEALILFENCLQLPSDDPLLRMHIQRCTMLTETPS